MADVDEYPLSFLPPMRFDPFSNRGLMRKGGAGGSPSLTWRTGYPYDLMEDIPPLGARNSISARGGAVKYMDPSYPGVFPQIDRYYAFVAKEEEISLWGYVKQAAEWNWKVVIPFNGKKVEQTLFDLGSQTYLGAVIKDQNKESSVWGYSENGKRNYKIIADSDEAKLEAWDVTSSSEAKYIIATTKDWPQNVAGNTKNKRLVLASESYKNTKPQLVKLRELELDLPGGCPFDLTFSVNEDSDSAVGAVKHTSCTTIDGEKVGSGVYERYAAANADTQQTGFTAYFGTGQDGYLDASTKGQAETFVWGYADQGESNFRARAFGYDGKLEAYHTNNQEYVSLYYTTADSGVYGFHNANGKYWRLYGTDTRPELQLWMGDGRAWASIHAQPSESVFYGWCDTEQSLCRIRAIPFKGQVELWRSDGQNYALMEQKPGEASFYAFSNNQAFNFKAVTTPGNQNKSEVMVWSQGNDGFASVGTKGQEESYFWAYADQGQANVRMRGFGADWAVEGWNNQLEKSLYIKSEDFPSTTSSQKPVRLVVASERYKAGTKPTIVKLRELPDLAPRGCPYDVITAINEDVNSASGAVKHTGCTIVDGEKQGNNVYDRYAAANADGVQTGFTTYYGTSKSGYLDCSTKGQAETFVYGYGDQGTSAFRIRTLGAAQSMELWSTASDTILKAENVTTQSALYGRFSGDLQYSIRATNQLSGAQFFNSASSGYLDCATKGQGETYVWGFADQGQTNFRLRALGAAWSVEAWNNGQQKSLYIKSDDFPSSTSSQKPVRLILASERYKAGTKPTIVQLRELPDTAPRGCPYDVVTAISEDSSSSVGAVKHTGCSIVDGEKQGNDVYERYASSKADSGQCGFVTYWDVGIRNYSDNSVKVGESYLYGYADNSSASHRIRSIPFKSEVELWKEDGSAYGLLRIEPFRASVWLNTDNEVYNVRIAADQGDDSSYCRVYGANNNVFGSLHTEQGKASAWGYSDDQQNLFTNEASSASVFWRGQMDSTYNTADVKPSEAGNWGYSNNGNIQYTLGAKSSECFVRTQQSSTYNSMDAKSSEAGNWGYVSNGSNAFTLGAKASEVFVRTQMSGVYCSLDSKNSGAGAWGYVNNSTNQFTLGAQGSEVFVRAQLSQSFVGISTKSATADIWGYTSGTVQWKCVSSSSQSKCQTFNSSGWAQISATGSQVSFDASMNNDYSYLTQNTLAIHYANGDSATVNPGEAWLNYSSGAWLQLYGGGVYMNDGANYVDIQPPGGKDAYFQQVTVCVDGEQKLAYVLMTQPE